MKKCCGMDGLSVSHNPNNNVVQCNSCGHVYTPASKLEHFLNRIFKWWWV